MKLTKKQIDREIRTDLENEFSKKELVKLITGFTREHTKLVKWLYDEHQEILREFEKVMGYKHRLYFCGGKLAKSN